MNNKVLIGILLILVLLFVFTQLDNRQEKKIDFFQVDSTRIAQIELSSGSDRLVLQKDADNWQLIYPMQSELDQKHLQQLFQQGLGAQTSSLPISESPAAQSVYHVSDSSGTIVRFFDAEENVLQAAVLGKSSQWNNTPARNLSEQKIYRLQSNINRIFSADTDYWRNKELAYFFAEEIAELKVEDDISSYTVTATDSLWKVNNAGKISYVATDNNFLQTVFDNLKVIKADKFYEGEYSEIAQAFEQPFMQIEITLRHGKQTKLTLAESDESRLLLMKLNEDESEIYLVNKWWSEKFVTGVNLM
ncbi:MAG: DUF4340 domain-containing protein [Candidatus Cloacimonadales bacterium]